MSQAGQFTPAASSPRKPGVDFSGSGLLYIFMVLFMGLAAINSQANLLFAVFGLMVGVLVVSAMLSGRVLRRLEVRRVLPDYLIVGHTSAVQYEFTNRKRYWPSLSVSVGEMDGASAFTKPPQGYLLHVAPGMSATVPAAVIPVRRGLYLLDRFQLATAFPFGFIKRAIAREQKDTVLIWPAQAQVDGRLLARCLSAEKTGATMRPRRGGADEFYGVKEYRPGENPRWIYWRRSARAGVLVSKEMTQVAPPKLLVVVDTFVAERSADALAAVERTIAMAGSLVGHALDAGMSVGLCGWSGSPLRIEPNRGKQHLREVMAALARLAANEVFDTSSLMDAARRELKTGTTAVLFTPRGGEATLADSARGGWLVISATSKQAEQWFRFDPGVDFSQCAALQE